MAPTTPRHPFYRECLAADEQVLLDQAPGKVELQDEIALVRVRVARLAAATSAADSPMAAAQLVKMLEVLTRMVSVQSHVGGLDTTLAELNDKVRRELAGQPA